MAPEVEQTQTTSASGLAWLMFLLLNATLFLRPAEIVPQFEGLPIYNVIMITCLLLTLPAMLPHLQFQVLFDNPITVCVFGMLPAIMLSLLAQGDTWTAREWGIEFFKVIIYYMLLISLIDSRQRFQQFLMWLAFCTLVLSSLAILRYNNIIALDTVAPMIEIQPQIDPATGQHIVLARLQAAGIYGNPNDLARILVVGITICLMVLTRKTSILIRALWILPMCVFAYGLQLTYSRGGLLALAAGLVMLLHARFGSTKGGILLLLVVPAMLMVDGRQMDIDTSSGTGQLRIQLWSNGLVALRSNPIFGIGTGRYSHMAGNHAHNSFIEAFVETGMIGGIFFTGAFFLAIQFLYRLKSEEMKRWDPELWRLRQFMLAIIVGSVAGQFSSSREYSLPTYMLLGLTTAYMSLAARYSPESIVRMSPKLMVRLVKVGVFTLVGFHLYTKFTAKF